MAIRESQFDLRYDKLKAPFRGHVLDALLAERNIPVDYSGSHSFQTEEEYLSMVWHDHSLPDEERAFDPVTGWNKNRRTFAEIAAKFPNLPTFAEIEQSIPNIFLSTMHTKVRGSVNTQECKNN